ncbi:MAG TPA: chorismate mutase [Elusimicrobiales bacterium]|nr:chorismate mutase [Elusimicrobiales bacterium]
MDNSALAGKRRRIDALDARLSRLLAERLALSASMAGLKKKVRDPEREAAVLERAARQAGGRRLRAAVKAVYREILAQGRALQSAARRRGRGTAAR